MYDSERKGFGIVFFSNNGPYSDAGNRCYGEVADDRLAMVGPARFQYELGQEGKIKRTPTARSPSRGGYVTNTAAGGRGCPTRLLELTPTRPPTDRRVVERPSQVKANAHYSSAPVSVTPSVAGRLCPLPGGRSEIPVEGA
jgi:hypothetical protein